MIVRIVKMTFQPDKIDDFLETFRLQKEHIKNFEGCTHLDLLRDKNNPNIFFTYSLWQSEKYLESYRDSEFFRGIWGRVKTLFADKPEAWTTQKMIFDE
jgi:quinol monooxygenase YgiN